MQPDSIPERVGSTDESLSCSNDVFSPPPFSAQLFHACDLAGSDFAAAVAWLKDTLPLDALSAVTVAIGAWVAEAEHGRIGCSLYLLAQAGSADLAAEAGWYALEQGCDDDYVLIALSDVLQMQHHPRQPAVALLQAHASAQRSNAFLIKLADHYRNNGQAFLAEAMLRDMIQRGRRDLILRLAEHWVEHRNWRSAQDLLLASPAEVDSAYATYLQGRCAVGLLLEDDVVASCQKLHAMAEPGPRYAALLESVWAWRIGDPAAAIALCPGGEFPPLPARDARALRTARLPAPARWPAVSPLWRCPGTRDDLPNVLGIGMQRCGTSWLWKQLSSQPNVHAGTFKELVFFDDLFDNPDGLVPEMRQADLGSAAELYWQGPTRSLAHYRALFDPGQAVRVDISPCVAELPRAAIRHLRELLGPDLRIILCVRDPVERSWSNLKHDLQTNGQHAMDFTFAERTALYRSVATLRRCDYAAILDVWRGFFSQIMIIFTDDILARPVEVLQDVSGFIGTPLSPRADMAKVVNGSGEATMPRDDRMYLLGLHQRTYDTAEAVLGGPALTWRPRQLGLVTG